MTKLAIPRYPGWLRAWHWANAVLFLVLAATGFSMHFASPNAPLIPFRSARAAHNAAAIAILLCYAGFLAANARSGNWRHYALRFRGLVGGIIRQARWYLIGIFRGDPHPFGEARAAKFNPLQRVTYLGIMYGWFPVIAVTGLFLLFPGAAPDRILGRGGIWPMAVVHALAAFAGTLFLAGHVYLATTGNPWTEYYRSMLVGDDPSPRRSR
jgi:thiosulfate reductase cytochrome b subunit